MGMGGFGPRSRRKGKPGIMAILQTMATK